MNISMYSLQHLFTKHAPAKIVTLQSLFRSARSRQRLPDLVCTCQQGKVESTWVDACCCNADTGGAATLSWSLAVAVVSGATVIAALVW